MTLLFQPRHIPLIRDGTKTVTWRAWADAYPRPQPGAVRMAVTRLFTTDADCDCYIRVTDTTRQPLGAMTEADARKEGGYTLPEFRDAWRDLHGQYDPTQVVDVLAFEYAGRTRPPTDPAQTTLPARSPGGERA